MKNRRVNIGILAHVDGGKTTLSEEILYRTGITRTPGRVDKGDAFLDSHEIERRRGITVFAKQVDFTLEGRDFTLIDTPGHRDFTGEVYRCLSVLDIAVFLIDGSREIPGRAKKLWLELENRGIPCFVFVNKNDLPGFEEEKALRELNRLGQGFALYSSKFTSEDDIMGFRGDYLALSSEEALDAFEKGEMDGARIRELVQGRRLFPLVIGSALKGDGVEDLLNCIREFSPEKEYPEDFGGRIYKIARDNRGSRVTFLKLTGGSLKLRDEVGNEKISGMRRYSGDGFRDVDEAFPGDLVGLLGLNDTFSGEGLGFEKDILPENGSLMTYEIVLPPGTDEVEAYQAFREVNDELPELALEGEDGIRLSLMGEVQKETLKEIMSERFGLQIEYGDPAISYMETIKEARYGIGHYEPLRHYAEVVLMMEPGERGRGIEIASDLSTDALDHNRQSAVLSALRDHKLKGVLMGAPLTDVRITLKDGRDHLKHTEGGDFREAGLRAYRQGLMNGESVILEPIYSFEINGPLEKLGRTTSDVRRMSGVIEEQKSMKDEFLIRGRVPLSEFIEYERDFLSVTGGRGSVSAEFLTYDICHNSGELLEKANYDPERDLEEPSSSVFCKSGAAVLVPWNQVEDMMHLPLERERRAEEPRERDYSFKELEAIFEMTYGKKTRGKNKAARIIRKKESGSYRGSNSGINNTTGERHLMVDGYNVIFRWKELKELAEVNMDSAREALIGILANYGAFTGEKITVVFDAYKNKGAVEKHEESMGVDIVFTGENVTADSYIERQAFERARRERMTVATSDRLEQMNVFASGAARISALELINQIRQVAEEIRSEMNG